MTLINPGDFYSYITYLSLTQESTDTMNSGIHYSCRIFEYHDQIKHFYLK